MCLGWFVLPGRERLSSFPEADGDEFQFSELISWQFLDFFFSDACCFKSLLGVHTATNTGLFSAKAKNFC